MKNHQSLFTALCMALLCVFCGTAQVQAQLGYNLVSKEKMLQRLLDYVAIESGSQEVEDGYPMTDGQLRMADRLADDARAMKATVTRTEWGYVYVNIPSNIKKNVPSIGISCHLDYTPEAPGKGIKPMVITYQGGVIDLGHGVIDPATPKGADLPNLIGKTIIHTDGTTLLGGDDKNGCAIVMSVIETVMQRGFKHGHLQFVFCPNEDIGLAALKIDTTFFNPDIVIDVDNEGGSEVAVSNFTAQEIVVRFTGNDAHPSLAKEQHLGDALAAASAFIASVPLKYRPEHTDGKQGYVHPWGMTMADDKITYTVSTRIRYFDKQEGALFNDMVKKNIDKVRNGFPYVKTEVVRDVLQYDNVEYTMHPMSLPLLEKAAASLGLKLHCVEMRAGTTASMFAAKGLRGGLGIFSGQHNPHSVQEYSVLEEMYDAYMLLLKVIEYLPNSK